MKQEVHGVCGLGEVPAGVEFMFDVVDQANDAVPVVSAFIELGKVEL